MNCKQARALLAIDREIQSNTPARTELETHLSACLACQEVQMQFQLVGERLRSLPSIQPSPDAHSKLMQALATEHLRFTQHAPKTPIPAFLLPHMKNAEPEGDCVVPQGGQASAEPEGDRSGFGYGQAKAGPSFLSAKARVGDFGQFPDKVLRDRWAKAHKGENSGRGRLTELTRANTAPLPVVARVAKRRHPRRISHFTIVGLAASFLIVILFSSLTSLLLLTQRGDNFTPPSLTVHSFNDVRPINYTTTPIYPHIASASAHGQMIYYSAYSEDQTQWQLEQFDEQANVSIPLLPTLSAQELLVLGSSADWLVWLQIDPPKAAISNLASQAAPPEQSASTPSTEAAKTASSRAWSLHARYLGSLPTSAASPDRVLTSQNFNPSAAPAWVTGPVQGINLTGDTLLATMIDEKGISHLEQYQLDPHKDPVQSELAHAEHGHILASPTANSDGSVIYWADEYFSLASGQLMSNIWTQQTTAASPANAGRWTAHQASQQYLFRSDGASFDPKIVNDTLFLLSANQSNSNVAMPSPTAAPSPAAATATVQPSPTPTPTMVPASALAAGATKADPRIFVPQIDSTQTGKLLTFTGSGVPQALPQFDSSQTVTLPQAGASFLLWQKSDKTFGMYDAIAKAPVHIGDNVVPTSATFLAVNSDTAISIAEPDSSQGDQAPASITFYTFKWPTPRA